MFRVHLNERHIQAFIQQDPRKEGFSGEVEENVSLDFPQETIYLHPPGEDAPEVVIGVSAEHPKGYKVFKYERERQQAGYRPISGKPHVFYSWQDCLKGRSAAYDNSHNA